MVEVKLKSYLFVIDSSTMKLSEALGKINDDDKVENWHKILPDAATLVSQPNISQLNARLKSSLPGQRYILTRLKAGSKNGWLSKNAWTAMNQPTSVL